jgi:hypothetical protein
MIEQGGAAVKNWMGNNWQWALPLGLGVGGVGLYLKNQADRRREEEEEELLQGMRPKIGMVKLAQEFPVQVGFLARCGERKLTGREVRAAVEKCAALSDGLAEDWIRFFDVAAKYEAETSSGMEKTAFPLFPMTAGFNATANQAAGQAPKPPLPTATPPPQKFEPATGGSHAQMKANAQPLPSYAEYRQPRPPAGTPPVQPAPQKFTPTTGGAQAQMQANAQPIPGNEQYRQPRVPAPAAPGSKAVAAGGAPQPQTQPPPPPPPGQPTPPAAPQAPKPYMTNTQQLMANAASDKVIAARAQWMNELNQASRRGDMAEVKRLTAQGAPKGEAMGAAGANRAVLSGPAALQRRNLVESRDEEAADQARGAFWNSMARNKWMPTREDVEQGMAKQTRLINRGMDPTTAAKGDWTSSATDPTLGSYFGGFSQGLASAPASLISTAGNALWDTGRGLAGQGFDYSNTAGAARDFFAPVARGFGAQTESGAPLGPQVNKTFFQDTTPGWADQLHEYAGQEGGNPILKGMAGFAETPTRWAGPIISAAMLSRMPLSAPGHLGVPASVASGLTNWLGPTTFLGRAATNMGIPLSAGAGGSLIGMHSFGNALGQFGGGAQQAYQQEMAAKAMKDPASYEKAFPQPQSIDDYKTWSANMWESQRNNINAQREAEGYGPMNAAEEALHKQEVMGKYDAKNEQLHNERIAKTVPGFTNPDGSFNPNGRLDPSKDPTFNPDKVADWMNAVPGRAQAINHIGEQASTAFTKDINKMPQEMQARLSQPNAKPTEADLAFMKQNGIDPQALAQNGERAGRANALLQAQELGGSVKDVINNNQTPQKMVETAENNPSVREGAEQRSQQTGEGFMASLSKMWTDMGPMGQILAVGGLALGAIGLMGAFSGEGGLGSMLMGLIGGGGLLLGLNKGNILPQGMSDVINPILQSIGLGDLAGGQASAAAPQTGPGGEPLVTAPGGGPNTPGPASGALGIINDPAARAKLMQSPQAEQDKALAEAYKADPTLRAQLDQAAGMWGDTEGMGIQRNIVRNKMRQRLGPQTSEQEIQGLINAARRAPR